MLLCILILISILKVPPIASVPPTWVEMNPGISESYSITLLSVYSCARVLNYSNSQILIFEIIFRSRGLIIPCPLLDTV
jgi:hypothetical protein